MAEKTKVSVPKFDATKCKTHLVEVEKTMLARAGQPGQNPYLWLSNNLQPLREQLEKGITTSELQTQILALKAP